MALSYAVRAVVNWPCVRASAPRSCSSCIAKLPARSSRLAWMAAFILAVKSLTSFLYFDSSFSSKVTFALTMAMLSFMCGTWSFISRMFCSRISSGSSATEMKKPKNERNIRCKRLHIGPPSAHIPNVGPGLAPAEADPRVGPTTAGCLLLTPRCRNGLFGREIGHGVGDLLLLLLLLELPAEESLFLLGHFVVVGLDARLHFVNPFLNLGLKLLVFLSLSGFLLLQSLLLQALVGIQGFVAPHRVLDHFLGLDPGGFQGQQERTPFDVTGKVANVLALEEINNFQNGKPVGRDGDFRRLIDLLEGSGMGYRTGELGLGCDTGGNFGDCLGRRLRRARLLRGSLVLALLWLVY